MSDDINEGDMEGLSPQRKAALRQFEEAKKKARKGALQEAINTALDALDEDPSCTEIDRWIAQTLIDAGENARASRRLQDIVTENPDNDEAWEMLREIDPKAADKVERLQGIAPDPFVARRQRQSEESDLFEDIGDFDDDEQFAEVEEEYMLDYPEEERTGEAEETIAGPDQLEGVEIKDQQDLREEELTSEPTSEPEDVILEEEAQFGQTEGVQPGDVPEGVVPEPSEQQPPQSEPEEEASAAHGIGEPVPWAFEQEYEFRQRLLNAAGVADILEALDDMEDDFGAWDQVLVSCAHMNKDRHKQVYGAFEDAADFFGVEMPDVFLAPERRVCPIVVRANPAAVTITTGVMKAFEELEVRFIAGRLIAHLALDDHEFDHVVTVVLQRTPATITDIEQARLDVLGDYATGWDIGINREQRQRTEKIAHAWHLRNQLSADRGGLLFAGDLKAACHAIAKSTCRSGEDALELDYSDFVSQFEGMDPRELAEIDIKQDPMRSPQYGAYRILMLKWWAQTDQYKALAAG